MKMKGYHLRLRLELLPFLLGILFVLMCGVTYSWYGFQGRFVGYLPTISETAVGSANTQFFSSTMATISLVFIVVFYIYLVWGEVWGFFPRYFVRIGQFALIIEPVLMIGLAVCSIDTNNTVHMACAIGFFFSIWIFTIWSFCYLFKKMTKGILWTRIVLVACSFIALILFNTGAYMVDAKNKMTITSINEVLFLLFLVGLFSSFYFEFKSLSAVFFVEEEEEPNA